MQTVRMNRAFHSEWMMSECVDNFSAESTFEFMDILAMDEEDAEAIWNDRYDSIFEWDRERVHFTISMLRADKTEKFATVTFDDKAIEYVTHELSLEYQIGKWEDWASNGDDEAKGFVRTAKRILENLSKTRNS